MSDLVKEYLPRAIIELTSACNLRCRHCYNWWKQDGEVPYHRESYKKAFRLVEHLIDTTTVEHITFTGGEPTISERFAELVLHAKLRGKKVTIISNGNGPADVYRQLADWQVDMLELSIHAARPEIHDEISRVPGSWEKAVGTMKEMLRRGVTVVPVIVVTSINHEYVEETMKFFLEQGIRSVMVNRYNLGGEGLNHPKALSASVDELRTAFKAVDAFGSGHGMAVFSGVCTPHCILNPDDYPHIRFGSCSDDVYRKPLTFDIEGNMRLCNHSPVEVGNILRQPLSDIFCSTYMDAWSNLDLSFCRQCTRLSKCRGGCRAASEQMGLPLDNADPLVHELGARAFITNLSI